MGNNFRDKDCLSQIASVKDVLKDILGNVGKLSITTSNAAWAGQRGEILTQKILQTCFDHIDVEVRL